MFCLPSLPLPFPLQRRVMSKIRTVPCFPPSPIPQLLCYPYLYSIRESRGFLTFWCPLTFFIELQYHARIVHINTSTQNSVSPSPLPPPSHQPLLSPYFPPLSFLKSYTKQAVSGGYNFMELLLNIIPCSPLRNRTHVHHTVDCSKENMENDISILASNHGITTL